MRRLFNTLFARGLVALALFGLAAAVQAGEPRARAAMLVAAAADAQRFAVTRGTVVWSAVSALPGQPGSVGVKAEVDIPHLKMHASITLRKNTDAALPASHTIDLRLIFDEGSPIKGVKDIDLPRMRRDEFPTADPLLGVKVKINDSYFLIGLNRADADVARNIDEIATRRWFDFPLLLNDDRIAKLTFEKAADGERIVADALSAWKGGIVVVPPTQAASVPTPAPDAAPAEIPTSSATSQFETSGNFRWIVYASRKNVDEAIGLARRFDSEFGEPIVMSTSNGWFAVAAGPLNVPDPVTLKKKLSESWLTPKDAFLSRGQTFVEKVWESPKSPILAKASSSEKEPHIASAAGLEVRVGLANNHKVVRVRVAGREVAGVTFEEDDSPDTSIEASIARLDTSSALPQVVVGHFTGGAHCCTDVKILTFIENRWDVVSLGKFDSDGPAIMDLNGDGSAELVGKDDSFNYAFASYAEFYAPPKILRLIGNQIRDVSTTSEFQKPILQMLLATQGIASPDMWRDNGFLAGWVGHNAMIGGGAEAWRKMLGLYNRNSDWDLSVCTVPTKGFDPCPENAKRFRDFPTALAEHLSQNGYNLDGIVMAPAAVAPSPPPPLSGVTKPAEEPSPSKPPRESSSGTGFFVTLSGVVLTNAHVVEGCSSIRTTMSQGGTASATIIARDIQNDLALLGTGLVVNKTAAFRSTVRLGEAVEAFGYPLTDVLSKSGNFTLGNVSALIGIGEDSRYLQISAPVQPGNSGGPLLDQSGNLVGVVSAKLNALRLMLATNGDIPQNVNFAIKSSIVTNFLDTNGIGHATGGATQPMQPADLADQAKAISVFIECD